MNPIVIAGIVLGLLCGAWTFVMGFTGWYKDPSMVAAFWLVLPMQAGVLLWALRRMRSTYWRQVGRGTLISAIAAVIVFGSSLLFTTVAFPQYFDELRAMQAQQFEERGLPEAQIEQMKAMTAAVQTPLINAVIGFVATILTGFVLSLIVAAFARARRMGAMRPA